MRNEVDLDLLLRNLSLVCHLGCYVFATGEQLPIGQSAFATIVEEEGTTLVLRSEVANQYGLSYDQEFTRITLQVHSSLTAVGLTAAVTSALANAGISCNVIAGKSHDHLFVPVDRGNDALKVLERISKSSPQITSFVDQQS